MLLAYVSTPRYEGPELDNAIVEQDTKQLYKAGEKKIGTDEKMFIKIFSEKSSTHLAAVTSSYKALYGNTLEKVCLQISRDNFFFISLYSLCTFQLIFLMKAIKKETSSSFMSGLLTILRCATNPAMYFAKVFSFLVLWNSQLFDFSCHIFIYL